MDKGNKLFDEQVKQKMLSNDSAFDESAWALMEQKLDATGTKKVPIFWWLSGMAALLVLAAGMWMFLGNPSGQLDKKPGNSPVIAKDGKNLPNESQGNKLAAEDMETGTDNAGQLHPVQEDGGYLAVSDKLQRQQTINTVQQSLQTVQPKPIDGSDSGLMIGRQTALTMDVVHVTRATETAKQYPQWVFGFSAAPDFNAVGSFDKGRIGYSVGAMAGLQLSKRLSIQTGLVYAKKTYEARGTDYAFSWPTQNIADVYANCDVLDIPLNLSYTVFEKPSTRIKISTGLSSYFMLSEKYDYQRDGEQRNYQYKNENRHVMGVLNAGLGIERKLNKSLSLGIQPYVKIPLTGIGAGEVELISTGISLQLNISPKK